MAWSRLLFMLKQKRHWATHKLLCKRHQKLPVTMLGQHELQLVGTFYWAVNGDGESSSANCVDLTELNVYLSCTDRVTERTRELYMLIIEAFRKTLRPLTLGQFLTEEPLGAALPLGINGSKCFMVARESEAKLYPWSLQALSTYIKQPAGAPPAKACPGVSLPPQLLTHRSGFSHAGQNVMRLPCYKVLMPAGVPAFPMPPRPEFFTVHTLGWYGGGEGDIACMNIKADPRCDESKGKCFCIDQPRRRPTEVRVPGLEGQGEATFASSLISVCLIAPSGCKVVPCPAPVLTSSSPLRCVQLIKYSSYRAEGLVSSCIGEGDVVLLYPGIHESHVWTPKWTAGFELYGVGKEEWYVCF